MGEIVTFLIAAFSFLGGAGVVSGVFLRRFDRMEKKMDKQEEARIEESVVIVTGIRAIGHLSEATAIAQKQGHANGETETAMKHYREANDELNDYLLRRAAERTHGRH